MKKILILSILIALNVSVQGQTSFSICAGSSVTIQGSNPQSLSNPTYSLNPGNLSNPTGSFVVTPSVTTVYTVFCTGQNSSSTLMTTSVISTVVVNSQPLAAPTTTSASCTNTFIAINLNLSFYPSSPIPAYTISWTPLPAGLTTPQQWYTSGNIASGSYSVIIFTNDGCFTTSAFTILPQPVFPDISISASTRTLNCDVLNATLIGHSNTPNVSYMWNWGIPPGSSSTSTLLALTANTAAPTQSIVNTYTLSATESNNTCTTTYTTISIYQNLYSPNPIVTVTTGYTITCATPTIILTNGSTTGIPASGPFSSALAVAAVKWYGPPPQNAGTLVNTYLAYTAGVYTMEAVDLNNGCRASTTFSVYDDCNLVGLNNNLNSIFSVKIVPNPNPRLLVVASENPSDLTIESTIIIYSMNGQPVKEEKLFFENKKASIKTDDLKDGIYFIQLKNHHNETVRKRFVINR